MALHESLNHFGIERRTASGDPFYCVHELGDVPNTILEQVPHSPGVVSHQLEHVGGFHVLRENEHRRARMRPPYLRRRNETVVGVAGWHTYVDDRDVGRVTADLEEQIVGAAGATDHLMPDVLQ
jgi:hypothetical protein